MGHRSKLLGRAGVKTGPAGSPGAPLIPPAMSPPGLTRVWGFKVPQGSGEEQPRGQGNTHTVGLSQYRGPGLTRPRSRVTTWVIGTIWGHPWEETTTQELQLDANAPCAKWEKMNFTPRQSDFYHVNDHGVLIMSAAVKWGLWMFFF